MQKGQGKTLWVPRNQAYYRIVIVQTRIRGRGDSDHYSAQRPGTTEGYLRSIGMEGVREALESLSPKEDATEIIAFDKMFGTDSGRSEK